jgi:hypothetical protein
VRSDDLLLWPVREFNLKYQEFGKNELSTSLFGVADSVNNIAHTASAPTRTDADDDTSNGITGKDWAQCQRVTLEEYVANIVKANMAEDNTNESRSVPRRRRFVNHPCNSGDPYDPDIEATLIRDAAESKVALQKARAALIASMKKSDTHLSEEAHFLLALQVKQRDFDVLATAKMLHRYRLWRARDSRATSKNHNSRYARQALARVGKRAVERVSGLPLPLLLLFLLHR